VEEIVVEGRAAVAEVLRAAAVDVRKRGGVLRAEPVTATGAHPQSTEVAYAVAPWDPRAWPTDTAVVKVVERCAYDARGLVRQMSRTSGAPFSHYDLVYWQHHTHTHTVPPPAMGPRATAPPPAMGPRAASGYGAGGPTSGAAAASANGLACDPRVLALLAPDVVYEASGSGRWQGKQAVAKR
jgi:hypothetical protein